MMNLGIDKMVLFRRLKKIGTDKNKAIYVVIANNLEINLHVLEVGQNQRGTHHRQCKHKQGFFLLFWEHGQWHLNWEFCGFFAQNWEF